MMKTIGVGALVALLVLAPIGMSGGVLPVNPIVNGDFEAYTSAGPVVPDELEPTVAQCHGIGHQAFYGSESVPGKLTRTDSEGTPSPDAEGAASHATDPDHLLLYSGAGESCFDGAEHGQDLVWLQPSAHTDRGAVHWSHHPTNSATTWGDFDGDGDREAKITADASLQNHNLWQAYPSPFQGWTMDANAFTFRIENGATPAGSIIFTLSATPIGVQSPYVGLWFECQVAFRAPLLQAAVGESGVVSIDPVDGAFTSRDPACDDLAARFNAPDATDDEKRAVLGSVRIVQISFWNFDSGERDIIIDDVTLVNARTVAEGAPNAQLAPTT